MADLIVRCCDPEEVLLFGSYAKGNASVHSDIDLLVLCDRESDQALQLELTDVLRHYSVTIDIHVMSTMSVPAAWADRGSFLYSVLSYAVPVYSRSGQSVLEGLRTPNAVDNGGSRGG